MWREERLFQRSRQARKGRVFRAILPYYRKAVRPPRGRGGMADAADLRNLSARRETGDAELLKVGKTSNLGNPEPSLGQKSAGKV
jgi:hypothetical protein